MQKYMDSDIPFGLQVVLEVLLDLVQMRVMGPEHLQPTLLARTYIYTYVHI